MIDLDPIRNFIRREFLYDKDAVVGDDDPLFPDVVDSLGVMEVVDFVEETYGVEVDEADLLAENFKSLKTVGDLISRKGG